MSKTPKTDKFVANYLPADYQFGSDEATDVIICEMASTEREIDQLAKQCVKMVEELGQLRAALEQEERRRLGAEDCLKSWKEDEGADAARLDWLDNHVGLYDVAEYFVCDLLTHDQMCNLTLREGIDAAMEAQNDEQ